MESNLTITLITLIDDENKISLIIDRSKLELISPYFKSLLTRFIESTMDKIRIIVPDTYISCEIIINSLGLKCNNNMGQIPWYLYLINKIKCLDFFGIDGTDILLDFPIIVPSSEINYVLEMSDQLNYDHRLFVLYKNFPPEKIPQNFPPNFTKKLLDYSNSGIVYVGKTKTGYIVNFCDYVNRKSIHKFRMAHDDRPSSVTEESIIMAPDRFGSGMEESNNINTVAKSSNGKFMIIATDNGLIIYDTVNKYQIKTIYFDQAICNAAFFPDNNRIVFCYNDDVYNNKRSRKISVYHKYHMYHKYYNYYEYVFIIYDMNNGSFTDITKCMKNVKNLNGHTIDKLFVTSQDQILLALDNLINIIDYTTGDNLCVKQINIRKFGDLNPYPVDVNISKFGRFFIYSKMNTLKSFYDDSLHSYELREWCIRNNWNFSHSMNQEHQQISNDIAYIVDTTSNITVRTFFVCEGGLMSSCLSDDYKILILA